jgi:hypothetical protein
MAKMADKTETTAMANAVGMSERVVEKEVRKRANRLVWGDLEPAGAG